MWDNILDKIPCQTEAFITSMNDNDILDLLLGKINNCFKDQRNQKHFIITVVQIIISLMYVP